jgi:tetratricopeptide (TPR) repeat protein
LNYAGQLQQKRFAEDERLKGNEFMKSKEYQDAVNCYSKSLEIMKEAATYSNRAMAYLKLKNYN